MYNWNQIPMSVFTKKNQFPFTDTKKENHYNNFPEYLLITIFVVIGLIGTLFNLSNMTHEPDKSELNPIYQESAVKDERDSKFNLVTFNADNLKQDKPILSNQLSIGKNQEATIPVHFKVANFNKDATYHLSFGDGVVQELIQNTSAHVYKNPGQYQVKLEVTYRGERRVLDIDHVNIMQPFTVAANAVKYDF